MIERRTSACTVDPSSRYENDEPRGEPTRPSTRCADAFVGSAITDLIDGGLLEFVRNTATSPTKQDDVLHIGMNRTSAKAEVDALSARAHVTALQHGRDGVIQVAGTTYDLNTDAGMEGFAGLLRARGLGPEQADAVLSVIRDTNTTGKDEIAQLALLWTEAERGEAVPGRIVISGHSTGMEVWDGGGDGEIAFDDVRRLAKALPRAAMQIEDIHISACSTGGQAALEDNRAAWVEAFPNLKTLWAYDGAAPPEGRAHLPDWEQATRGSTERLALTATRAKQSVGVWDRVDGYRDGSAPLEVMRTRQAGADGRFEGWMSASRRANGSEDTALVADYRTYRALSVRSDLQPPEREVFRIKAEQLLRLRYFEGAVRTEIDRKFGSTIAKGFADVGLPAPHFAKLSYREALAKIESFERACAARGASSSEAVAEARAILADIRSLDWARIPARWCRH